MKYAYLIFLVLATSLAACSEPPSESEGSPNVIIIFTDDQGYGDLGAYGATGFETPHLDQMAAEGIRFTDFYVAAPVCTPSRAALLTGSYPKRVGLAHRVLFPHSDTGLHPDEVTLAEVLKPAGYATAAIGKWHLGHHPPFLPTRQGFDTFFGIPYSNDMGDHTYSPAFTSPPLPLMQDETVIEENPDQTQLTRRYTEAALDFISAHRDDPFFLYLAHPMPHVPIAASEAFEGSTTHGPYGDVIAEIDWSVGQILDHLAALGLDENTLVFFTSDNGPQVWEGTDRGWRWTPEDHGRGTRGTMGYRSGSAGPLRGRKNTTWEGGMRVPSIMRWPARIPGGRVSSEVVTAMDLLPTIAHLVGAPLPTGRILDGHDIRPLLFDEAEATSSYDAFYYYRDDRLQAVRSGSWKLHVYRPEWQADSLTQHQPLLFNLEDDIGEATDVAASHPDVVARLQQLAERARHELGDAVTQQAGVNVRPIGRLNE